MKSILKIMILTYILSSNLFSQSTLNNDIINDVNTLELLYVEYKFFRKLTNRSLPINEIHKLENYNQSSSFYSIAKKSVYRQTHRLGEDNEPALNLGTDGSIDLISYKNFDKDTIMSIYPVIRKYKKVGEKVPEINWKLEKETKEILGYNCKKATTTYRGRSYIAYYTTDIPVFDGPFKFSGLPGLILSVYEENNKVSFEAIYIERKKALEIPTNPIYDEKLLSWNEYKKEYEKAFTSFGKFVNSKVSSDVDSEVQLNLPSKNNFPPTIEVLELNE